MIEEGEAQGSRAIANDHLDNVRLAAAERALKPGGLLAVVTFHSLEDRLVKRAFSDREVWSPLSKKPLVAGDRETARNPRSRSAKLRAARYVAGQDGFDDSEVEA